MRKNLISRSNAQPVIRLYKLIDTVEFNGTKRQVVLVAKTIKVKVTDVTNETQVVATSNTRKSILIESVNTYEISKLGLGLAVCNPVDIFDEQAGIASAAGRALNRKDSLGIIDSKDKSITAELANFMLHEKMKHIKKFPRYYFSPLVKAID